MAVTAMRKTLGKALEDFTVTRDRIEAVGETIEKIVSSRLTVAPGMGESGGGSGEEETVARRRRRRGRGRWRWG